MILAQPIRHAALVLTATFALAACRGEDPAGSATDTDPTTTTTSATEPTTGTTTGVPTTSTGPTPDPTTDEPEPTTTNMSAGFITTDPDPDPTGGNLPNGSMCQTDDQCASMKCYTTPLFDGGLCSDCKSDADCMEAGTGISCSLGLNGAVCVAGGYGNQCMSQAACQDGLLCGPVIQIPIPGIIPNTCGECLESDDCDAGLICTPELDIAALSGAKKCAEPGSVENGALCPLGEADADAVCASGHCGEITFMNFVTLGACGECKTDADCMNGTCTPGTISQGGVVGSVCK